MIIYLASPYTSKDPILREARYRACCLVAGRLIREGHRVYSPIAMCHAIAQFTGIPTDYFFWEEFDKEFLSVCGELWVLMLSGWKESVGVEAEIHHATSLGIPIRYISFDDPSSPR